MLSIESMGTCSSSGSAKSGYGSDESAKSGSWTVKPVSGSVKSNHQTDAAPPPSTAAPTQKTGSTPVTAGPSTGT